MKQNKRAARFGPKWWDRGAHFSTTFGGEIVTWGADEWEQAFVWPRPCEDCVAIGREDS